MITVGIQENILIDKVEQDDKGGILTIHFLAAGTSKVESGSILDMLAGTSSNSLPQGTTPKIWPVKYDDVTKTVSDFTGAFQVINQKLNHFLEQFMPNDQIKWNPFQGIQYGDLNDTAEMERLLSNDQVIAKMYDNMCIQFIQQITPHLAKKEKFRVKFIRQSQEKNFPTLPKYAPFIEPMTIPAHQSKLSFSKYEKEKGLDSGVPAESTPPPKPDAATQEKNQKEIDSIFNNSN